MKCGVACLVALTLCASTARADPKSQAERSFAELRRYCPPAAPTDDEAPPERCTALAFEAMDGFRSAGMPAKAIAAGRALVGYASARNVRSTSVAKASRTIGTIYRELALFELAAEWYARTAAEYPKDAEAEPALRDATALQLALGRMDEAVKSARTHAMLYGRSSPKQTAQVTLAIGQARVEREEWREARAWLVGSMPAIERGAIDTRVTAHALLARAAARSGNASLARSEYAAVVAAEHDPSSLDAQLHADWPEDDDAIRTRRLARILVARGEALFAEAEAERASLGPAPHARDARSLAAHVKTSVAPWVASRAEAITKLEASYAKVLAIAPFPPPTWVVASSAAVAASWTELADALARLPAPKKGDKNAAAYYEALDAVVEPIRVRRAKPACMRTLDLAAKYQVIDDGARSCSGWLSRTFKAEHHAVDEIAPRLRPVARAEASPMP